MAKVKILPNLSHAGHEGGDVIEVTDDELRAFGDKFEVLEGGEIDEQVEESPTDEEVLSDEGGPQPVPDKQETLNAWEIDLIAVYGLDDAEEISLLSDEEILSVDGIGPKTKEDARKKYPFIGDEKEAEE